MSGIFLDAVVGNLTYQVGDDSPGTTTLVGNFEYIQDQPITFSMGGVALGTLDRGAPVITPFDFPVPENIARFIQSFDVDLDPSNGILISYGALQDISVPSSVFENPDRASFESDPAVVDALQRSGLALVDAATAMSNLQSGTDNSFSVFELADQVFPFAAGFFPFGGTGYILFDALASPGARGSTGEFVFDEDLSTATGQDFTWDVSTSGVLTLDLVDDAPVVITRAGGTDRIISGIVSGQGEQPEPFTFFRPLPLTETDVAGAPISPNGGASQTYDFTDYDGNAGSFPVTFNADGTYSSVESGGIVFGTWSVNALVNDVIVMIPTLAPNAPRLILFLDGDLCCFGRAFVADATITGGSVGNPELTFTGFSFPAFLRTG